MMSKYQGLGSYLLSQPFNEVPMTFSEIERVTGVKLPPKAQLHRAWWSNNPSNNVMTKVWLAAGFQTERVDMVSRKLIFKRKTANPLPPAAPPNKTKGSGMSDAARPFAHAEDAKPVDRHPLIGAMAGTFTIEPGYDLTSPMFSDEELAEIDANLERTADMIEQGMAKMK